MAWQAGARPPAPGRYAVTQGGSWFAANWTDGFGWFDGAQRVLGVKAYCAVPLPPEDLP